MGNKFLFEYEFQIYEIPLRMRGGIERYVQDHIRPGNFLQAVIKNDLKESVMLADGENMMALPAYMNYFYNYAPPTCWGSGTKMEACIKMDRGGDEK